jgi:hypothetical protein
MFDGFHSCDGTTNEEPLHQIIHQDYVGGGPGAANGLMSIVMPLDYFGGRSIYFGGPCFNVTVEFGQILVFMGDVYHGGMAYDRKGKEKVHSRAAFHLHVDPLGHPRDKDKIQFDFDIPGVPAPYVHHGFKEGRMNEEVFSSVLHKRIEDIRVLKEAAIEGKILKKKKKTSHLWFTANEVKHVALTALRHPDAW